MLQKLKKNYITIILSFLLLYFLFNLLGGERGLISYNIKRNIFKDLKIQEKKLLNKISNLEQKNSLLTGNIDLDYIEILIRKKFLYGKKNETTYIIESNDN